MLNNNVGTFGVMRHEIATQNLIHCHEMTTLVYIDFQIIRFVALATDGTKNKQKNVQQCDVGCFYEEQKNASAPY